MGRVRIKHQIMAHNYYFTGVYGRDKCECRKCERVMNRTERHIYSLYRYSQGQSHFLV